MKKIVIPQKDENCIYPAESNVSKGILVYDIVGKFIGLVVQSAVDKRWYIRSWDASMDGYEKELQSGCKKYTEYETLQQLITNRPHYTFNQL